jgi:hypothetical protein
LVISVLLTGSMLAVGGLGDGAAATGSLGRSARLHGRAPLIGVDLIYADYPHVLIKAFQDQPLGRALSAALRHEAGVAAVRFSSHGFYSARGERATERLREETKAPNQYPWFDVAGVGRFARRGKLGVVVGVNVEEPPSAAVEMVEAFRAEGATIVAVELGNEPHLSHRPWQPEEFGHSAAAIVRALEPYDVQATIPLTLGSETKTPTGLSDDEYTRRLLRTVTEELGRERVARLLGVIHLYSRGVNPGTLDRLAELVRPWAPEMRFLVTEYNIRSSLADNDHLTTGYALEFLARTGQLVAHPRVEGLFVHGVPYHSVLYWAGDGVVTVSGQRDARLSGADLAEGWHPTPAGRLLALFGNYVWAHELLEWKNGRKVQVWRVRTAAGEERLGVLNTCGRTLRIDEQIDGVRIRAAVPPRSAMVYSAGGYVAGVELPRD